MAELVEEYSDHAVGAAVGENGEQRVLEGFAKKQFVLQGRNANSLQGRLWTQTDHDLDFIFERDGIAYGVEVKNTLGYMEYDELAVKIRLCKSLGLRPVFVVRMLPKPWLYEVDQLGGFALIMKYQLYPRLLGDLARRMRDELGLPVDSPRALEDGTVQRFVKWRMRNV